MGIFSKKQNRVEEEPIVYIQKTEVMKGNDKCRYGHAWNGITPTVVPEILSIQNKELIGVPCDCRLIVYNESECGCQLKKWQVSLQENISQWK